jgi:hypothetical protein
MAVSGTYLHFDKPFFHILSSMGPTYTDKIFSFLCQMVFSNKNFKKGTFLQPNFLPQKKGAKSKKNLI